MTSVGTRMREVARPAAAAAVMCATAEYLACVYFPGEGGRGQGERFEHERVREFNSPPSAAAMCATAEYLVGVYSRRGRRGQGWGKG